MSLTCADCCLMILSALSLITMPNADHLWNWDGLFQTSSHFELAAIIIVLFLRLALVLFRQRRRFVEAFLFMGSMLAFHFVSRVTPAISMPRDLSVLHPEPVNDP
jgi:hypothetical protein